jgi:acetylglutamate synthase
MSQDIVPKTVAGFKVPKSIRKSSLLKHMLASRTGREMLARALVAGANAAAAILTEEGGERRQPAPKDRRADQKAADVADKAIRSAAVAATEVMTEKTRPLFQAKRNDGPIFTSQSTH